MSYDFAIVLSENELSRRGLPPHHKNGDKVRNASRGFLVIGALYLLVGIGFGMYMGGSGDRTMTPVHAHINLLGFTLMTVFGLACRILPGLSDGWMAPAHFWLHQIGGLVLLIGLFLLITGPMPDARCPS